MRSRRAPSSNSSPVSSDEWRRFRPQFIGSARNRVRRRREIDADCDARPGRAVSASRRTAVAAMRLTCLGYFQNREAAVPGGGTHQPATGRGPRRPLPSHRPRSRHTQHCQLTRGVSLSQDCRLRTGHSGGPACSRSVWPTRLSSRRVGRSSVASLTFERFIVFDHPRFARPVRRPVAGRRRKKKVVLSLSRRPTPVASFADMALFAVFCALSMLLAVSIQLGPYGVPARAVLIPALAFALITTAVGTMFGLFRGGERKPLQVVFTRSLLALCVGVPVCYFVFGVLPQPGRASRAAALCGAVHAGRGHRRSPGPARGAGQRVRRPTHADRRHRRRCARRRGDDRAARGARRDGGGLLPGGIAGQSRAAESGRAARRRSRPTRGCRTSSTASASTKSSSPCASNAAGRFRSTTCWSAASPAFRSATCPRSTRASGARCRSSR